MAAWTRGSLVVALGLAAGCGRVSSDATPAAGAGAGGDESGEQATGGAVSMDPCTHPLKVEDCHEHYATYAFNAATGFCEEVKDSGCRLTENRFTSRVACETTCNALPEPTCPAATGRAGGCPCTSTAQCRGAVCLVDDPIPMDPDDCLSVVEGFCREYAPLLGCWCTLGFEDMTGPGDTCWDGLEIE